MRQCPVSLYVMRQCPVSLCYETVPGVSLRDSARCLSTRQCPVYLYETVPGVSLRDSARCISTRQCPVYLYETVPGVSLRDSARCISTRQFPVSLYETVPGVSLCYETVPGISLCYTIIPYLWCVDGAVLSGLLLVVVCVPRMSVLNNKRSRTSRIASVSPGTRDNNSTPLVYNDSMGYIVL